MSTEWDDTALAIGPAAGEETGRHAFLVVIRGSNVGEIYPIAGPDMVIGRVTGADLRLEDEGVSRFHCKLRYQGGGIVIEDLNSRNGTFCNGKRITPTEPRQLAEGDRLQIGTHTILRFTFEENSVHTTADHEAQGTHDSLTGMYSRRYFVDRLEGELQLALQHRISLSLLLLQIDRFGEIEAATQQPQTDNIITTVAAAIIDRIRDKDIILARFTGGEFALMARAGTPGDIFMLAQRLRSSSAGLMAPAAGGVRPVTVSLAVAAVNELQIATVNELLIAADIALHRARSQGGDRVVHCTQDILREPKDPTLGVTKF